MSTTQSRVESQARERFIKDVAEHEMTVIKDDGLYRHLRFAKPGTGMYAFEIVTWPGYIAITGDMRSMTMSRVEDMVSFVGSNSDDLRIDFRYWDEKVVSNEGKSLVWSSDVLREYLEKALESHCEYHEEHIGGPKAEEWWKSLEDDILSVSEEFGKEHDQMRALFEYSGPVNLGDSWEWNPRVWDYSFLWRCFALRWGANMYLASKKAQEPVAAPV